VAAFERRPGSACGQVRDGPASETRHISPPRKALTANVRCMFDADEKNGGRLGQL